MVGSMALQREACSAILSAGRLDVRLAAVMVVYLGGVMVAKSAEYLAAKLVDLKDDVRAAMSAGLLAGLMAANLV